MVIPTSPRNAGKAGRRTPQPPESPTRPREYDAHQDTESDRLAFCNVNEVLDVLEDGYRSSRVDPSDLAKSVFEDSVLGPAKRAIHRSPAQSRSISPPPPQDGVEIHYHYHYHLSKEPEKTHPTHQTQRSPRLPSPVPSSRSQPQQKLRERRMRYHPPPEPQREAPKSLSPRETIIWEYKEALRAVADAERRLLTPAEDGSGVPRGPSSSHQQITTPSPSPLPTEDGLTRALEEEQRARNQLRRCQVKTQQERERVLAMAVELERSSKQAVLHAERLHAKAVADAALLQQHHNQEEKALRGERPSPQDVAAAKALCRVATPSPQAAMIFRDAQPQTRPLRTPLSSDPIHQAIDPYPVFW